MNKNKRFFVQISNYLFKTLKLVNCIRNPLRSSLLFYVNLLISHYFDHLHICTGYPSELFYRGVGMWETIYGLASAYPIVCFVFVPIYLNLGITSVYQYLDMR